MSSARQCLEHRHAYVRKNSVLAIQSIFSHSEHLIPDAPDLILAFLQTESDNTCKRNAFAALSAISHEKALEYLNSVFDGIANLDELTQLVLIEFIRKDAVLNLGNKVRSPVIELGGVFFSLLVWRIGQISPVNLRFAGGVFEYCGIRSCYIIDCLD